MCIRDSDTVVYAIEAPTNGGLERCEPYAITEGTFPRAVGGVQRQASLQMLQDYAKANPQKRFVTRMLRSLHQ